MMLAYIKWDVSPVIFTIGDFSLRWYSLLVVTGYLAAFFLLERIFEKENIDRKQFNKFVLYVFIGAVIGFRLGHCLFYDPIYYLTHPIEIFKSWKGGLASHGGAIGILIAIFLYARKYKQKFFWLIDRLIIVICIGGAFTRVGNLMNSEIIGKPTAMNCAFLFVNGIDRYFEKSNHHVFKDTEITQTGSDTVIDNITLSKLRFDAVFQPRCDSVFIQNFIKNKLPAIISSTPRLNNNFRVEPNQEIKVEQYRNLKRCSILIYGIPRHPSQIYEAVFYILLFIIFYALYRKKKGKIGEGIFFGAILSLMFTYRFLIEFFKEKQVEVEQHMMLNIGQWLSIPFIIAGILIIILALNQKRAPETGHP